MKAHSNYHAKEIIDKILSLNRKGYHQAKIAKELGISPATIRYQLTKHAFESVKHIKIKASWIKNSQYNRMSVEQLQLLLWTKRMLKTKCENYLYDQAKDKPKLRF